MLKIILFTTAAKKGTRGCYYLHLLLQQLLVLFITLIKEKTLEK